MLRWLLVASFVLNCGWGFDEVLILTQGRSGANFLGELLNKGHRVAYLHEPCRSMVSKNSPLGPFTAEKCAALVTRFLSCTPLESELDAFTKDTQAMERSEDWVGEMRARSRYSGRSRRSLRDLFLPPCRASSRIVTETRLFAPSAPSSSSLGAEDSTSSDDARLILQALMARPSLAVVHLVRDARAVVASRLNLHGLGACSRHNPPQCAVDLCQQMEEAHQGTQALSTAGRYRLLRFEDLISAPTAYAAAVYQWLRWGELPAEVHEWAASAKENYTAAAATTSTAAIAASANDATPDSAPDSRDEEMESAVRKRSNGNGNRSGGYYGQKRSLPASNTVAEGQRSYIGGGGGSHKWRSRDNRNGADNGAEGSSASSAPNGYDDQKSLLRAAKALYRSHTGGWQSSNMHNNYIRARRRKLLQSSSRATRDDDGAAGVEGYRVSSGTDDDYSRSSSNSIDENHNFPDLKFQKMELRAMSVEQLRQEAQKLDATSSSGARHQKQHGNGLRSFDQRNQHHQHANHKNMQRKRKNGHKMAASRRDGFDIGLQAEPPVVYKWEQSLSTLTIAKTTAICKATLSRYRYPVENFLAPAPTGASALPWVQAKAAEQEAAAERKAGWLAAHLRGEPMHVDEEQHQAPTSLAAMLRPHGRRALRATATNSSAADRVHGKFGHDWDESAVPSSSRSSNPRSGDSGSSKTTTGRHLKAWPASASETGKKQPRTRSSRSNTVSLRSQGDHEGKASKPRLDLMLRADKEIRAEKKQRKEADRAQPQQHTKPFRKHNRADLAKGDFTAWTPSEESPATAQNKRAPWKKKRPFDREAAKLNEVFYNPA